MKNMIWAGQGPILIGRYDADRGTPDMGYLVDLYRVGCVNRTLTTTTSRETTKIKESDSGQRLDYKTLTQGKSLAVKLEMAEFSGRSLAAAFWGDAVVKEEGSVTGEVLPALVPGDYFFLRNPHVSSVVVQDSTGTTPVTYVAGTHYVLESAEHARFKLIAHPTTHVEPVTVDYEHGGYVNIAAMKNTDVERGIVFSGVNQDGDHARVIIPRISLALDGDFSWITDEEATLSLSGDALYVPGLAADDDFGPFMRIDALPA